MLGMILFVPPSGQLRRLIVADIHTVLQRGKRVDIKNKNKREEK